jgi:hypothetical protein
MAATAATVTAGTKKYAARKTPRAGARRTRDDLVIDGDTGEPETDAERTELVKTQLANLVNERVRESINARRESGIESEWKEADDLYNGLDDLNAGTTGMTIPDKTSRRTRAQPATGGQSTLYVNIAKPKTKVAVSRIKEMLVPTNERPWDVSPTPVPELDEVTKNPDLAGQNVTLGDGTQAPALMVAEKMMADANKASDDEANWIEDRFVEGKVYGELRKVIDDAGRLGTGVLKGPFSMCRTTRRWKKDDAGVYRLEVSEVQEPTSKRVRVQDCFPDGACGNNIHLGNYFNERDYVTARELRKLAKDPEYDQKAVAQALLEGPISYAILDSGDTRSRRNDGDTVSNSALFELWYCYGDCTPEALIAMGVKDELLGNLDGYDRAETVEAANDEPDGGDADDRQKVNGAMPGDRGKSSIAMSSEDSSEPLTREEKAALASIPAIVTMLNGRPIKAAIQPLESGEFPFDYFAFEPVEGQPYGRGVPNQVRAAQLMVKSGVRRLMENGGLSSGPQMAYTPGVLEPQNGRYEITGRKLWKFIPNDVVKDIKNAMAFFTVPSVQAELMEIIRLGLEFADILSNIPLLLHGDEAQGAAPETLGGLKLFENNAMSPLRDIAKGWDDGLMIPHLGRYHEWWMAHSDNPNKGDSEVKALGSTALIQREEGRMFLMQLFPVKDDPKLKIDPAKYSKEVARAHGYDMSLIQYSDEDWKKVQEEAAKQPPPKAPQVEAAEIRAQTQEKSDNLKAQLSERELAYKAQADAADNALKKALGDIQLQIEEMRLAGTEKISLIDVKAMLAAKAGDIRSRRDEMLLKLAPQNQSHLGI